jgi:hypothetical protein
MDGKDNIEQKKLATQMFPKALIHKDGDNNALP